MVFMHNKPKQVPVRKLSACCQVLLGLRKSLLIGKLGVWPSTACWLRWVLKMGFPISRTCW